MYLRWLWVSCLCPLVFFLTITFDVNWLNRVLALTYSLLDIFFYSNLQFPVNAEKLTTWQTNPSCDFTFGIFSEDVFWREQLNCLRLFLFKEKQTFIVIGVFIIDDTRDIIIIRLTYIISFINMWPSYLVHTPLSTTAINNYCGLLFFEDGWSFPY
jgi:hypothetical protein